jgi:hypothetical protein
MSRYARNVDDNQARVVAALRRAGAMVVHLHTVGNGCPDLAVGWRGRWVLVEVKDGDKAPARRRLTPAEAAWHDAAHAHGLPVVVVESVADAVALLNAKEATHGRVA